MTKLHRNIALIDRQRELAKEQEEWTTAKGLSTDTLISEMMEREITDEQFREILDWLATCS